MKTCHSLPVITLACLLGFLAACDTYTPVPRKYGFHRIDLPAQTAYVRFQNERCPFTFEYPDYGVVTRQASDSCWVDINYPPFDLKWHIAYRDTRAEGRDYNTIFEEYRRLIYQHSKKASRIEPSPISVPAGRGTWFEVYGNVGTPVQGIICDSTGRHVIMVSCYFQTALKNDSLAPVITFMKGEFDHMLRTVEWKAGE
ncbi:MAG: hypothetical protein SF053_12340 [Bacteroidia bacterium]|nr:hypothetical protein [Bacteroidia bacterium]